MSHSYRVHVHYIIGILVGIIALLLTVDWGSNERLAELLGFGLALTSMILALTTIVFSFLMSQSIQKSSSKHEESADITKQATEQLQATISRLPDVLESVQSKVTSSHSILEDLASSANFSPSLTTGEPSEAGAGGTEVSTIDIDKYLDKLPITGLMVLRSAIRLHGARIAVDMDELNQKLGGRQDYLAGFLSANHAAGVLTVTESDNILNFTQIHRDLSDEKVESSLRTQVTRYASKQEDVSESDWDEWIERVHAYLASKIG